MHKNKIIAAYVPVLHRGYLDFFDAYPDVSEILVFDQSILEKEDYLRKELRALSPLQQVKILNALGRFKIVKLLKFSDLKKHDKQDLEIIMPDEDVSHKVAKNFNHAKVSFYPVFLRWDRRAVSAENEVSPDRKVSYKEFDKEMMEFATAKSIQSSNIWRRVGAVITKNGKVISSSSNHHMPTDHNLWVDGDPRSTSKKGVGLEITTDMHAEARLIANAAQDGTSLKGASIYVTNFPCPNCAKLIAESGISKCFYSAGYAMLDGENVLNAYDVEIVHVNMPENDGHPATWVPYKKSS